MSEPKATLFNRLGRGFRSLVHFVTSALFINNLLALIGASAFLILFVSWWLRCYTHHGQKLIIKNYVGVLVQDAREDADDHSFELVVEDSVFMVDKPAGVILAQNPAPGASVRENRKIYVTITKEAADQIPFASLPMMYGKEINVIRKTLKQRFQIDAEIVGERFDEGPPNVILEVIYMGDTLINRVRKSNPNMSVDKGGSLQFVISKDVSESVQLPNLDCQTLNDADFLLKANRLVLGELHLDETVTNRYSAFVVRQQPAYASGLVLAKGDTVQLWLTQAKPARCPDVIPDNNYED